MKIFKTLWHLLVLVIVGVLLAGVEALKLGWRVVFFNGRNPLALRRALIEQAKRNYQEKRHVKTTRRADPEANLPLTRVRAWYATPMTEQQFQILTNITVALRTVFSKQMTTVVGQSLLNSVFNVQGSTNAMEHNTGIGEFGDPQVSKGEINYDSFEPLYPANYTHVPYNLGMSVERELVDDDQTNVMAQRATKLGLSFNRFVEKQSASVFNNAFVTTANGVSTAGPDAVALCSASHPNSPTDATVQSNAGVLPLTPDNIITTRIAMQKYVDNRGNILNVNPDTLVVPIDLVPSTVTMVRTQLKPGVMNNDINFNNLPEYTYNVVGSRYLTDTNNWFMLDSQLAALYLHWYWRVRPEFTSDPASDFNLKLKFRGYMRFVFGWDDWTWVYGHNAP